MKIQHQQYNISSPSNSTTISPNSSTALYNNHNLQYTNPFAILNTTTLQNSMATNYFVKAFNVEERSLTSACTTTKKNPVFLDSSQLGAMRWNPTSEQVETLEALYNTGLRTPTTLQIEYITTELKKFGRIEGKNVFYWFQNHKSRERLKQKRRAMDDQLNTSNITQCSSDSKEEIMQHDNNEGNYKRKCMSLVSSEEMEIEETESRNCKCGRTLVLFPLHPEIK